MKALMRAVNASGNDGKLYDPTGDSVCCRDHDPSRRRLLLQSRSECANPVGGFVPSIDSQVAVPVDRLDLGGG
jgi:hypothetical protein